MKLPTTTQRHQAHFFDSLDFDKRYVFPDDGHIYVKSTGRKVWPRRNRGTGYEYYRLTRNDGERTCISAALFHREVERMSDGTYHVDIEIPDTKTHPNWPSYVFDYGRKVVWRIGFRTVRREAVQVSPNRSNQFLMTDYKGDTYYVPFNEIFV